MKKMQTLTQSIGTKLLGAGLYYMAFVPGEALATNHRPLEHGSEQAQPSGVDTGLMDIFSTIANILLLILGAVAVIMLIVGGFRYVVSGGDSTAVEGAKNTILYAIIGIVVAFLAYAAVNFVVGQLQEGSQNLTP